MSPLVVRRLILGVAAGLLLVSTLTPALRPSRALAAPDSDLARRPWSEDVVYLIMIDRFNNGDKSLDKDAEPNSSTGVHGGDLQGVIDKLDYLQKLGVTAIWLTPVVQNQKGGYHGYWTTDFYQVDERLGSMATLQKLVQEAHRRQMKVLLDVVVNHTAPTHPWINDPAKYDWFHHAGGITNWNNQASIENGQLAGLPDLAQENPAVEKYLLDMSRWWIEQTNVDGFRLDTVRHVPAGFWEKFAKQMHETRPGFFLMGEAWNSDLNYLKKYLDTGLDSLVDFARFDPVQDVFARGADPSVLHATIARQALATPGTVWGTFIDNHDVPRFVTGAAPGGANKLKLALTYLLTTPGMPILYYGTEVALEGGDDPDNRRDMKFDKNPDMQAFTAQLIKLRRENPAFTHGTYTPVTPNPKVVAYFREYQGQRYLVALNNSNQQQRLELSGYMKPHDTLKNELGSQTGEQSRQTVLLEPWTAYIYTVSASRMPLYAGAAAAAAVLGGVLLWMWRRPKL
ncbi:MAG TPA: alpha-amylase family glycosyl hydrolase [Symbiobacteriaceae bacterium]|jgi:alpha-amylase